MLIRREIPTDFDAITDITAAAFTDHPFSRNTEQFIIKALREADALALSLVAEKESKLVGHIAFSQVTFTDETPNWYGLGPVSVLPGLQRQGIGSKLINEGLNMLREMGANGCVLVGDPDFYHRFGFKSPAGLKHEGVPQENLLVISFCGKTPTGLVQFHPAFHATE